MDDLFNQLWGSDVASLAAGLAQWVGRHLLSPVGLAQMAAILVLVAASRLLAAPLRARIEERIGGLQERYQYLWSLLRAVRRVLWAAFLVFFCSLAAFIFKRLEMDRLLLDTVGSLALAWIVISLCASVVRNRAWARTIAVLAWLAASLDILGLLGATQEFLDHLGFDYAGVRISALLAVKAAVLCFVLFNGALLLIRFVDLRLSRSQALSPSARVLAEKSVKVGLYALAGILAVRALGVDFTSLAFLSGAIAVGVGFGLQKVISNLVCGVILLLDRSIKPGDVIQVGETAGRIQSLNARFASVVTRDNKEYLIPNDELITNRVVNWTYSSRNIRLRAAVGIAYASDLRRAIDVAVAAVRAVPRVLRDPEPRCLVTGFGDNAVNLELRFFVADPENGVANVRSEVLLAVWDAYKAEGIEFPFPQRDLYLKTVPELAVRLKGGRES